MTLKLVSEARPIPWQDLSKLERSLLRQADDWLESVLRHYPAEKTDADGIDRDRTGRIVFIRGQRGAGKTTFLLTLLKHWSGDPRYSEPDTRRACSDLTILPKILDFDPLPLGMPLHGWLLEPWRSHARTLEHEHHQYLDSAPKGLLEQFAEVFERAVVGWTRASVEGKGVVEKAIAYQEQVDGWIETRALWQRFVDACICRTIGCKKRPCGETHKWLFVVAVDDVDLQVEQVPGLLHAVRLLHHPSVIYVLTGDMDHMRFALELDYLGRHASVLRGRHHDATGLMGDDLVQGARTHSKRLRDALLDKAIPEHAWLSLPVLDGQSLISMAVGDDTTNTDGGDRATVGSILSDPQWKAVFRSIQGLRLVSARAAQHAIDRRIGRIRSVAEALSPGQQVRFVADLCGTSARTNKRKTDATGPSYRFTLRGRIRTKLGRIFRAWSGDRLRIVLATQPEFEFLPEFDENNVRFGEEAHRALVTHLAFEHNLVVENISLEWQPIAGFATTEVRWDSTLPGVPRPAVFHWPWLVPPTATQTLGLRRVAKRLSKQVRAVSRTDLDVTILSGWVRENIKWWCDQQPATDAGRKFSPPEEPDTLKGVYSLLSWLTKNTDEAERWVGQLLAMTAPYFRSSSKVGAA